MKTRTLYVPANVSLRNEVWRGLSVADAVKSFGGGVIAAIACTFLHFATGLEVIWCVLCAVVAIASCITFYTQLGSGLSIKDYLRISAKFSREQKRFYYVHRRKR